MALILLTALAALPGAWEDGYVTYYGGVPSGGGACGFPGEVTTSFPSGMYAASDFTLYDSNKACGACYEMECTGPFMQAGANNCVCASGSITFQVDNSCCDREYNTPHFDLNPVAMDAILDNDIGTCGVAAVRFRQVDCAYNAEGKNVKLVAKSGTSPYWYAFFVWDVAGTGQIETVRIKSSGSSTWVNCPLAGAYHQCGGTPPYVEPLTVELTDTLGEVLVGVDAIQNTGENAEWDFGTNFGRRASPPVGPATAAPGGSGTPMPVVPGSTSATRTTPVPSTTLAPSSATLAPGTTAAPSPAGGSTGLADGYIVLIVLVVLIALSFCAAMGLCVWKGQQPKRVGMNEFLRNTTEPDTPGHDFREMH